MVLVLVLVFGLAYIKNKRDFWEQQAGMEVLPVERYGACLLSFPPSTKMRGFSFLGPK